MGMKSTSPLRPEATNAHAHTYGDKGYKNFLEIFSGTGNLTASMKRHNVSVLTPADIIHGDFDLTSPNDFRRIAKIIKEGRVKWLHLAPPCSTFSRARKDGLRKLGFWRRLHWEAQQKVREADTLARNTFRLATLQVRAGGFVSIENPEFSLLWKLQAATNFLKLTGVYDLSADQCVCGGLYVKPTRWRSNCPWLQSIAGRCPGQPTHIRHQPLRGWMQHGSGTTGWLTALGAEYPEGLCDTLAAAFSASTESPAKVNSVFITEEGTIDPLLPASRQQLRREEDKKAIGGMRSPHHSIEQVPGWKDMGAKICDTLDKIIDDWWDHCKFTVETLGKDCTGLDEQMVEAARRAMEITLGLPRRDTIESKVRADLVQALTAQAADPDDVIAEWLRGNTPIGIKNDIPCRGIFPLSRDHMGDGATAEEATFISQATELQGNYTSVAENPEDVSAELKRERDKGFLRFAVKKETLERETGKLILSKVGAITTWKNLIKKIRLIHDLRRSRVNKLTRIPERVVLPRLLDAALSMLEILRNAPRGEAEVFTTDFSDAFKHLFVCQNERRYLGGMGTIDGVDGYFVYLALLFGAVGGPLLWGRVAAWLMRCTASIASSSEVQLQCFVDDPLAAIQGTPDERARRIGRILLLWRALNFKVAWHKTQRGSEVEWIGALFTFIYDAAGSPIGVDITITVGKISKMRETASGFYAATWINRVELKQFAGLMSWAGSVVPSLKPYVQMLWGAAYAEPAGKESAGWLSSSRVSMSIWWILKMLGEKSVLRRRLHLHRSEETLMITFDASLQGGGATFQLGSAEAPTTDYIITVWSQEDHDRLGAEQGKPDFQADWEAYMLLLAVKTWSGRINDHTGNLVFRGDAKGVLQGVLANRARNPRINLIVAEISLVLSGSSHKLTAEHIWSERNTICDELSRAGEGGSIPASLHDCVSWPPVRAPFEFLGMQF